MARWFALVFVVSACGDTASQQLEEVTAAPQEQTAGHASGSWRPVASPPIAAAGLPLLLTDGTVMVQESGTPTWWRLTPDREGSYAQGTWSELAPMPTDYSPLYMASAVLPDGRVIIEGGEYLSGDSAFTTRGAIYDPVANAWTEVAPPPGWRTIGDASGMVLANGRFLLSSCCDGPPGPTALLDASSLTWTPTGGGKIDLHDEESWVMLWDDRILTIDCNNLADVTLAEAYDPATGMWSAIGHTPIQISDTSEDADSSHEIGPHVLQNDGTVLAIGANGHNVTYDPSTDAWRTVPDLPVVAEGQLDSADGPAATLPNGHVLIAASPGVFGYPTHMLDWDGAQFTEVAAPPNAEVDSSFQQTMLVLPTGELLLTDGSNDVELYTPAPGYPDTAVPVITDLFMPMTSARLRAPSDVHAPATAEALLTPVADLYRGQTYKLAVQRMNGVTQGAYYGDDSQSFTNYPIARLTYASSGRVVYGRTYQHSNRAIGPDKHGTTLLDVPLAADQGLASLQVIANGIPSPSVLVNIK
ncbi:MAG TPA: hypothetical protein VGM90_26155 [Kofleriaceae bacterium]|jgi:hypothetical protein